MRKYILLSGLSYLINLSALDAQNYVMNGSPVADCNGTFLDSGGSAGSYSNNQSLSTTICSDGSAGTHIRLDFSGVDIAPGDELCFHDGANVTAPLLACSGDYMPGQPFVIQATAVNSSGCLTVTFNSDATGVAGGWSAVISCRPSCQQVLADLVSTNPIAVPADTGWIDTCPGQRIFFNGKGEYPQNGFAYQQSDLTTTFEWNFGDGGIAYGPNVSHRFDEAGGYFVQLVLTDAQGCRSTNLINQRIRVAPKPQFTPGVAFDNTICAGDTIQLSASIDGTGAQNVLVEPAGASFAASGSRSDSLALPDGTGIPYETSIYFTEFSPGQVLTDVNDLESICVNMEHSWMRDLEIKMSCPNGQTVILHNFGGQTGSQVFLGIPNDNDFFAPIPGSGFDYCWVPGGATQTWLQYANNVLPGGGTLPSGYYKPFNAFNNLLGCPLNGEWTITVTDLWAVDNGYIFSWSIDFNPFLYPTLETFSPALVSWGWSSHPSIFSATNDSIVASPQNAGTAGYTFSVTDQFGCTWDTLVNISVLPFTHPDCFTCLEDYAGPLDTTICSGATVDLNAAYLGPLNQEIRFEAFPDYPLGNGNHPHNNPFQSPIAVNSLGFSSIMNAATQIRRICIAIETDFNADLNIYLRSPDGKQLELSTGNGGSGDNYNITCFEAGAPTAITAGISPFNGSFRPEGSWNNLNGALVNGDWKLVVSDGFGINQVGKVKWWSISFDAQTTVNYNWSNAGSLSCNNCPNPQASPASNSSYILTAVDNYNCIHRDTVQINVLSAFAAPGGLNVSSLGQNSMTWSWQSVPGAGAYEVRVNGAAWTPAGGGLSHTVAGLQAGDVVQFEVRAANNNPSCPAGISAGTQAFVTCTLSAALGQVQPVVCNGTPTGSAVVTATGNQGPMQFWPDGVAPGQPNGIFTNFFTAGNHFVIVVDSAGCRDTVTFTISEPPAVTVIATGTDASCNGDNSGSAAANGAGGTGIITYRWQNCNGGPILTGSVVNDLFAGCYRVTATDANGCTATDTVQINQPPPFQFSSMQDSVSCNGGADGSAVITVGGGQAPYSFLWGNGSTSNSTSGLPANFHAVTVTDALGCQAVTLVQVLQPAPLVVDSIVTIAVKCSGGMDGAATAFVKGGTKPYTYSWPSGIPAGNNVTGLAVGQYILTVTDANGCTRTSQFAIAPAPPLVLQINSTTGETCAGLCNGTAVLNGTGGTAPLQYLWSGPTNPGNTASSGNLCPGQYTVTLRDANGCTVTVNFNIQAGGTVSVQINETPATCAGLNNGALTATASGATGPVNYSWSNGGTGAVLNNVNCTLTYRVTVTDGAGCTATATFQPTCPPSITAAVDTIIQVRCFGENNGRIRVVAGGGAGNLSYLWNDPNGQTLPTAVNLAPGNYTVTITDANGCTTTLSGTITQPPALTAVLSAQNVSCFGQSTGSASAAAAGGTPNYTYAWSNGGTTAQISNIPAGTYQLTVTDSSGCSLVNLSTTVSQPATAVTVAIVDSLPPCFNRNNGAANAQASGGAGAPFTYVWSNGLTGAGISGLESGVYSVTATDAQGCTAGDSFILPQLDTIRVNVAFNLPSCFGTADGDMAVNLVQGGLGSGIFGNYQYQWSVPGSPDTLYIDGLAGGQTYRVTVTDAQGCTGVASQFINQPPPLTFDVLKNDIRCFGTAEGSAQVTNIGAGQTIAGYAWSNGGITDRIGNLQPGTYIVTLTNANGCQDADTVTIVEPPALLLEFDISPVNCFGDSSASISLTVSGGTPAYTYNWATGGILPVLNQIPAGDYPVIVTDGKGCSISDTITVQVPETLNITPTVTNVSCFGGANGRVEASLNAGIPPFRYSLNGTDFQGSSVLIGLKAGTYTLYVRDGSGCTAQTSVTVGQPDPVVVDFGPDTTILFGAALELSADISNAFAPLRYLWSSSLVDSIRCVDPPECSIAGVQPPLSNTYRLTVQDANGCTGTDALQVNVEKPRGVLVPTGFSPNGDFANDLLVVHGEIRMVKEITVFRVYNRWGELVYEDQNFGVNENNRGWNGQFRSKDCDPGVYVWYLEVLYNDGFTDQLHGNTTLIR
jgi:gliding motility-associated-like protein